MDSNCTTRGKGGEEEEKEEVEVEVLEDLQNRLNNKFLFLFFRTLSSSSRSYALHKSHQSERRLDGGRIHGHNSG